MTAMNDQWGPPRPEREIRARRRRSLWARLRVVVPIVPMMVGLVVAGLHGKIVEAGCAALVVVGVGLLLVRDWVVERRAQETPRP